MNTRSHLSRRLDHDVRRDSTSSRNFASLCRRIDEPALFIVFPLCASLPPCEPPCFRRTVYRANALCTARSHASSRGDSLKTAPANRPPWSRRTAQWVCVASDEMAEKNSCGESNRSLRDVSSESTARWTASRVALPSRSMVASEKTSARRRGEGGDLYLLRRRGAGTAVLTQSWLFFLVFSSTESASRALNSCSDRMIRPGCPRAAFATSRMLWRCHALSACILCSAAVLNSQPHVEHSYTSPSSAITTRGGAPSLLPLAFSGCWARSTKPWTLLTTINTQHRIRIIAKRDRCGITD